MPLKDKITNHLKYLKNAVGEREFSAHFDMQTLCAEIHMGMRSHTLYPQFIIFVDGDKHYTSDFTDDTSGFCGWRPYQTKIIEEFGNKLAVKKMFLNEGLATPEFSEKPASPINNVIVKKAVSSFGFSIQGPFKKAKSHKLDVEEEEYYEKFIEGTIVKAWFWNQKPISYEYQQMPHIIGDGIMTIRQHMLIRLERYENKPKLEMIEPVIAYYGYAMDDVLEKGRQLVVDFRYGSKFGLIHEIEDVSIQGADTLGIAPQLEVVGKFAWQHVPDNMKNGLAYSVDSILDDDGKLWFLEINCNPMIQPHLYAPMIEYLYEITDADCLTQLQKR